MSKIKAYYSLTKPGVLYGNAITAAAGYLLASRGMIEWWLFLALCVGSTLVIASACVLNNYLDQDIDKVMARTKKRAIVSGKVSGRNALIFSVILGIVGLAILVAYTNPIVVAIGVVGFVDYVVLYGMLSKRLSVHGTLVGSISGAMPILAGYCAATGAIDLGAFIVFAILFLWQMPEFYSIAIYRRKEYQKAGVPVISVMNGVENTKYQIIAYTVMFVVASVLLAIFGYAGSVYLVVMSALGGYWIGLALQGLKTKSADEWARRMFHFSLVILLAFCGLISVDAWLP